MRFARGDVKGHIDVLKPYTKVTNIHGHVGGPGFIGSRAISDTNPIDADWAWLLRGQSRAFSADGPPQAPVAPRRSCEAKYMRADEFAALRRAVIERRYRKTKFPPWTANGYRSTKVSRKAKSRR